MARGSKSKDLTLAQALGQFLERTLIPDLRLRVEESPSVKRALDDALARERAAGRTADDPIAYRERTLEQVGAAWLLDCVFVRFLEDRGFVSHRRIAGDRAVDAQERFGAAFPGLAGNAREYLLAVFREAGNLPGARELLGARHDVARRLGPSAGVAGDMLRLFREELPDKSLRWRFDSDDTRVLGDLYQDLSAAVRERYALLQTPDFVEAFILDRTLDPAVKEFGLDGFRMIDPTCGSGHFVLGAFHRLRALHERNDPSGDPKQHALAALQHVYGVDLNPFAVAITRFRLLVAYLGAAGIRRLREAPAELDLAGHVVIADSLLDGGTNPSLADSLTDNAARRWFGGEHFVLEDPMAGIVVFGRRYHAVVGNPPYIVCRDSALRDRYRERYPNSAQRQFALAAPFTERFFELGVDGGFVGLINSNSFMKREFGKGLVERVLPRLYITEVVDTSGAYIPGHGTPTVILFGRHDAARTDVVRVVMGRRGEPETPADPARGKVWSSIAAHDGERGFENEFITVADMPRTTLAKHPWSLGGGGASELKKTIEDRCVKSLGELIDGTIGRAVTVGEDDAYCVPSGTAARHRLDFRHLTTGDEVRDWGLGSSAELVFPYDNELCVNASVHVHRFLWPLKRLLADRVVSGSTTMREAGRQWFDLRRLSRDKLRTQLSIAFPLVSTHTHFALGRSRTLFKDSAPMINLPTTATEEDHLALLAWLNSSAACFWMKQVFYPKASGINDVSVEKGRAEANRYEFAGTGMLPLPVPARVVDAKGSGSSLVAMAREIETLTMARAAADPYAVITAWALDGEISLSNALHAAKKAADMAFHTMVVLQEEIDWSFYADLELCKRRPVMYGAAAPEERPFASPLGELPASLASSLRAEWTSRRQLTATNAQLRTLEDPVFKRPWEGRRGVFGHSALTWEDRVVEASKTWLLEQVEASFRHNETAESMRHIEQTLLADPKACAVFDLLAPLLGENTLSLLSELAGKESIPYIAALRYTDAGLERRARWEQTWEIQRREDAGETVADIPVPPKYDQNDYRDPRYWSLRGKLDVPRERFIAYPSATTDDDPSPLYGWAGWDHRQRAEALTALYLRRKDEDGWTAERLLPLLAGLEELVPWLKQWHNAPQPGEDLGAGDAYDAFLTTELHAQGLTRAQVRGWRPPEKRAGRAAAKANATVAVAATEEAVGEAPAPKKRGRPKKGATPGAGT